MNDTVATEDLEQPTKRHERKARKSDRDPGCRTSSRPAEISSAPTGRTYDRSRPNRLKRQKSACQGRPSTYDACFPWPKRLSVDCSWPISDLPACVSFIPSCNRLHHESAAKGSVWRRRQVAARDLRQIVFAARKLRHGAAADAIGRIQLNLSDTLRSLRFRRRRHLRRVIVVPNLIVELGHGRERRVPRRGECYQTVVAQASQAKGGSDSGLRGRA